MPRLQRCWPRTAASRQNTRLRDKVERLKQTTASTECVVEQVETTEAAVQASVPFLSQQVTMAPAARRSQPAPCRQQARQQVSAIDVGQAKARAQSASMHLACLRRPRRPRRRQWPPQPTTMTTRIVRRMPPVRAVFLESEMLVSWEENGGVEMESILCDGAIALLDAHWLVEEFYSGDSAPLPRRQELPTRRLSAWMSSSRLALRSAVEGCRYAS